jgi:1,4-dihydroxy-2-naphthoate octaprenyltransferase
LPAASCGLFATGVLNVNNIRDIKSDKAAGKYSIPVRIGKQKAKIYHTTIIISGIISAVVFLLVTSNYKSILYLVFCYILFAKHLSNIHKAESSQDFDPQLKILALTTLLFVVLFGISILDL